MLLIVLHSWFPVEPFPVQERLPSTPRPVDRFLFPMHAIITNLISQNPTL